METDVAIQRSAEKWAAGESLYEQPEKVTFIYRSQKKGRSNPAAGRLIVKPSRSYDNELEASVCRDIEEGSRVTKVHDDLSVKFGKDSERDPGILQVEGNPVQSSLKFPSRSGEERYIVKGKHTDIIEGRRGHKKTRWKPQPEFGETSRKTRLKCPVTSQQTDLWSEEIHAQSVATSQDGKRRCPVASQQTDFWSEETHGQSVMVSQDDKHRPIPVEFHLKEDQIPISGPLMQCKQRPVNLPYQLSTSSSPSSSKEKPSSFVIVEVKDGPTFFYKPSDRLLSDSATDDEVKIPTHYHASLPSGRQPFSGIQEHSLADPTRNSSFSAYSGNFSFNKSEYSSFSSFRRNSSSSLHHSDSVSVGAVVPSSEDSPKSRSALSQLPKAPGLRKPDLSVLTTPCRKRDIVLEGRTFCGAKGCDNSEFMGGEDFATKEKEPLLISSVLPMTSTVITPRHTTFLPPVVAQPKTIAQPLNIVQTQMSVKPHNLNQHQNFVQPLHAVQPHGVFKNQNVFQMGGAVQSQKFAEPQNTAQPQNIFHHKNHPTQSQNNLQSQTILQPQNDVQLQNTFPTQNVNEPQHLIQTLTSRTAPTAETKHSQVPLSESGTHSSATSQQEFAYDSSLVFQNTSEIVQQKAGVKHDDIVVGPRRPRSRATSHRDGRLECGAVLQDTVSGYTQHGSLSRKHEVQGPGTALIMPKVNLSASTDGLSYGHKFPGNESLTRKGIHSESDFFVAGIPTVGSKPEHHAPRDSLTSKGHRDNNKNLFTAEPNCSVTVEAKGSKFQSENSTNVVDVAGDGVQKELTTNERKERQRTLHEKLKFGYDGDISRTRALNLEICPETGASYTTKSLDRSHKSAGEVKAIPKSASTGPTKQQLHSPKSKSSSTTPPRKLPVSSKLHMLSNIPVPINHDPPAKRYRPMSSPEATETNVPSVFEKELVSAVSNSSKDSKNHVSELTQEPLVPSLPQTISMPSDQASAEAPVIDKGIQSSASQIDDCLKEAAHPLALKPSSSANENRDQHGCTITATKIAPVPSEVNDNPPSTAVVENAQNLDESTSNSPIHVPAKTRLHRSTDQLLGNTKLTVFNSEENVPSFDKQDASSTNRTFQECTKLEKSDSDRVSSLKKANHELAKAGIMRRGSDRTEMCRRGSDKGFLIISNNDPSVEDLKKATSLRELCQSMASLLNIDNVKAAEMITTSLSNRQDLVEGLDADAILDYLSHHGVLDPAILVGLDDKASIAQRNSAIIRHVEEHGNTAVALFINALRQSGQLHLASSLDTEQRIKPVSGNTYFGKDRHKGEITIRIEIEALKIIAPREPRHDKIVDTSLLGSPGRQADETGVLIKDATDEEDFVKPKCWCFCFSYKSKIKALSKKDNEKQKSIQTQQMYQLPSTEKELKPSEVVDKKDSNIKLHRTKSQEKTKKGKDNSTKSYTTEGSKKDKDSSKKIKSSKSKSKVSGKNSLMNKIDVDLKSVPEVASHLREEEGQGPLNGESDVSKLAGMRPYILQQEPSNKHQPYNGVTGKNAVTIQSPKPDKEAWDPIIMEYNPKLELIKLRAGQEELSSPTRQSGNIGIMCEQWKSNGRHFQQKASQLCQKIVEELHTDIIKYFEQDRGTLVLDVVADISSILVFNICMMRGQVKSLQQEIADDSLLNKIQDMFFSRVDIAKFDIRGIKLRIILDEPELNIVLSELS